MSLRTAVVIILLILIILGLSQLFGILQERRQNSTSYLEETVRSTEKVRRLKEERRELIEKQEQNLLEPDD